MATAARLHKSIAADDNHFPIVGIGASAGGLEALTLFIGQIRGDSDMAYVVVQHLDPNHKGMLPELLQRLTSIPVTQAKNRMTVKPNHIYVIPPNKDLSILHGTLYLLDPAERHGLRLPIDFFLRTLAIDRQENAVGVILSGMGSDGMLGLRAIKENSGLTLVQDPGSAKFKGMPQSAVDAGVADLVAPAEELPERIAVYFRHALRGTPIDPESTSESRVQSALEKIVILLRERTGNDFALYKKNTLYRRIERRMALHQIDTIANYVRYLRETPDEIDLLLNELLIGVTSFFRDPAVWDYLKTVALPELLAEHPAGMALRAWIPACSTGEEAYTLAIVFKEVLAELKPPVRYSLQIFATDLDNNAIEQARIGLYPANIVADVGPERLARYFVEAGKSFQVTQEIREMVIFATQNIIMDPPFTKLDILSCRNLLIYLGPELQKKLIPLFHYALNHGGIMVLGSAESIGSHQALFSPLESRARIYRRLNEQPAKVDFPTKYHVTAPKLVADARPTSPASNEQLVHEQLRLHYTPAAVLTNADGEVLYISGRTGKYLEPAVGKANLNIHAMTREGLRHVLPGAIRQALQQPAAVNLDGLKVDCNGLIQTVNVTVQAIERPWEKRDRVMIVFTDVPSPTESSADGRTVADEKSTALDENALVVELQHTRSELQSMCEESQSAQEELKSTNEELQSTNEELQSTNEELTTSKEEMQALNEELHSVNAELEAKMKSMSSVIGDMQNLINSTEIATVFLDTEMRIRSFTPYATRLFKLLPLDVGRPLSNIVTELDYPQLQEDAKEVLRTLVFSDKAIAAQGGHWFKVRIMPYRSLDNIISGVVITFIDISEAKSLEAALDKIAQALEDGLAASGSAPDQLAGLEKIITEARWLVEQSKANHPQKANIAQPALPATGKPRRAKRTSAASQDRGG
ncbi:PAS domain-containing protein [Dechloromonas denitrificans]|nr:PAS domain-containing protein [Dechloromonas denitrificans]